MPHSRLILILTVSLLLGGCIVPHAPCDPASIVYPTGARLPGASLRLGVIDASRNFPRDLSAPLRQSQATLAVLDDVRWGFIEPNPPANGAHAYLWGETLAALDARVEMYQQAGFDLVIVLRAWNPWARANAPSGGLAAVAASTPPQPEYLDDYAAWVKAVVERYDADGITDAHSLRDSDGDGSIDPIRYYQIETEAVNGVWWQGTTPETTADDYITLLRTAAAAARSAYANVQILLAGPPGLDLLDGHPTTAELEDVVANIDPAVCGGLSALTKMLAAQDAYDIVALHSLSDYSGLAVQADWIATLAGTSTPVWVTAATSGPALVGDPPSLQVNPLFPEQGEALWAALQDAGDSRHEVVELWYRREQARLAVKKWVYAAWSGIDVLVVGLEQDRPAVENPSLGQRDLAFQGLLDSADGVTAPEPRPVIHALSQVQAQLSGYTAVERVNGLGDGIEAFRFTVAGLPVYVLWFDDRDSPGSRRRPIGCRRQPCNASASSHRAHYPHRA